MELESWHRQSSLITRRNPSSCLSCVAGPAQADGTSRQFEGRTKLNGACLIETDRIAPDPNQPRTDFDPGALDRLAASLKTRGQLQPIRVRWDEGEAV